MRLRSVIRRNCRAGRKRSVTQPGSPALWSTSASSTSKVYALTDAQGAVAEVKGEGLIRSTGRMYRQDYVIFLRAADGKIVLLTEYFDPVRAARALDTPILGLESRGQPTVPSLRRPRAF